MAGVLTPTDEQAQGQGTQGQGTTTGATQPPGSPVAQQQGTPSSGPVSTGGGAGGGGGKGTPSGTGPVSAAGTNPAPTNSGSYTNLNKYIQANAGFDQSQGGLGGAVASNINNAGTAAQSGISALQNAFNTQSSTGNNAAFTNANNASSNQTLNSIFGNGGAGVENYVYGTNAPSAANNYQGTANTANTGAFQNLLTGSYTGPQSLASIQGTGTNPNYANTEQQVSNAQNLGQSSQSEGGRMALLQQMFGGNNYNQGEQNLDNLFIQSSPQQMQALQQAAQGTQNIGGQLTQAQNASQSLGSQYAQNAQALNAAAQGYLGVDTGVAPGTQLAGQNASSGAFGNLENTINSQIAPLQAQLTNTYNTDLQNANAGNFTAAQAAELGINPGENLYGYNFSNLPGIVAAPTATQNLAATPDQYAQYQALLALATPANGAVPTNAYLTAAPTATYDPFSGVSPNTVASAIGANQNNYNTGINNLLGMFTAGGQQVPTAATLPGEINTLNQTATGWANAGNSTANPVYQNEIAEINAYNQLMSQYNPSEIANVGGNWGPGGNPNPLTSLTPSQSGSRGVGQLG